MKALLRRFQTPFGIKHNAYKIRRKGKPDNRVDDAKRPLWEISELQISVVIWSTYDDRKKAAREL